MAFHDTWPYFARRFDLRIDVFLEPKPGIPPTPANLAAVIERMRREDLRVILVEPYQNRRTAKRVAAATGAVVLDVAQFPGGVPMEGEGYLGLIDHLVGSLARALEGGAAP